MRSLRPRIALVVALVAAAAIAFVGVVVDRQATIDGRERLRDQAIDRVSAAATGYEIDGLLRYDASSNPKSGPAPLRTATKPGETLTYYDGTSMWASQYAGQTRLTVSLSADSLHLAAAELRKQLLLAGLIAVAIATLLGWLTASSLTKRLRQGVQGVHALERGEKPPRITGHDEVATLWGAVQGMADRLDERVARERAFSADVAHELRTPVTALVSASELLPAGQATDLVKSQVARLRRLVEDLLEVARLENAAEDVPVEQVDLAEVVRRIAAEQGIEAEVLDTATVWADPRRVERVLVNSIANARKHAQCEPVVRVQGSSVVVEDQGPGFSEELIREGPQRFRAAGKHKGSGLGLTIAARQTEAMGGTLRLQNWERGAQIVIDLRTAD